MTEITVKTEVIQNELLAVTPDSGNNSGMRNAIAIHEMKNPRKVLINDSISD
jgi:hypothetical protein